MIMKEILHKLLHPYWSCSKKSCFFLGGGGVFEGKSFIIVGMLGVVLSFEKLIQ